MSRGASPTALLEIALDGLGVAHVRRARILADLAQRPALAQQVPAAIQLDLDSLQPAAILLECLIGMLISLLLLAELLLFGDEPFDPVRDALVAHEADPMAWPRRRRGPSPVEIDDHLCGDHIDER